MRQHFLLTGLLAMVLSCGTKEPQSGENGQAVTDSTQTDTASVAKEPTMNIEEATTEKQYLMVMNDSAATSAEIGPKLGTIFGKIGECASKCKMENSGPPVAWYNGPNAPWKFVAGMPFKTKCEHPEDGISNREIAGGKAVVVHFFGPYEMSSKAYEAAENYMKEKNLTPAENPYEVYIGDPMVEKDPYKVQTDIVFPIK
jgi:effector-binding domain-containing protein